MPAHLLWSSAYSSRSDAIRHSGASDTLRFTTPPRSRRRTGAPELPSHHTVEATQRAVPLSTRSAPAGSSPLSPHSASGSLQDAGPERHACRAGIHDAARASALVDQLHYPYSKQRAAFAPRSHRMPGHRGPAGSATAEASATRSTSASVRSARPGAGGSSHRTPAPEVRLAGGTTTQQVAPSTSMPCPCCQS